MRTLIVTEFISVDGVIDSPGGGTHPRAGWTFKEVDFDPAAYEIKAREQNEAGALLMGRVSYQEFAPVWPGMTEDFAGYNAMPKYVVSTTLTKTDPEWQPTTILRSIDDVARLKQQDGAPIIVNGSATLAQNLAAAGLVDRYHLLVFPVMLGAGKRLFTDGPTPVRATVRWRDVPHRRRGTGTPGAPGDLRPVGHSPQPQADPAIAATSHWLERPGEKAGVKRTLTVTSTPGWGASTHECTARSRCNRGITSVGRHARSA